MVEHAEPQAAVMPDFADAAGLETLAAAGGRSVSPSRSHGDGKSDAPSPAVAWPPPETPEPFRALVRQIDGAGSTIAGLWLEGVEPLPDKVCDQTADGLWPLAYYYGAGGDKPTAGILWMYAGAAVLGVVLMHVAQAKAAQQMKADKADNAGA